MACLAYLQLCAGEKTGELIYQKLGEKSLDILKTATPEELKKHGISGVGQATIQKIKDNRRKYQPELAYVSLLDGGVSKLKSQRIIKRYGKNSEAMIRENPYRLINDFHGIGWKIADGIAMDFGIRSHDPFRIAACLKYILEQAAGKEGHSYLPAMELIERTKKELVESIPASSEESEVWRVFMDEVKANHLIMPSNTVDAVYLPHLYTAERKVAQAIKKLCAVPTIAQNIPDIDVAIHEIEMEMKAKNPQFKSFAPEQREAMIQVLNSNLLVITGGPGTGKTTVLNGVLKILKKENPRLRVALAAPTGKAAQRMEESTGHSAQTNHRLLEARPGDSNEIICSKDEMNPLDVDVAMFDESSMVGIMLASATLCALSPRTKVIFIGDPQQLPSVDAGNFLKDLITIGKSGKFPVITLKHVYRQGEESGIAVAAQQINEGKIPTTKTDENTKEKGFFFIESKNPKDVQAHIVNLAVRAVEKYGLDEVQVLSPMHKTDTGVSILNLMLQDAINPREPGKKEVLRFGWGEPTPEQIANAKFTDKEALHVWRVGDKVMQKHNNKIKKLFNGMVGYIKSIPNFSQLIVAYPDRDVVYERDEWEELMFAYCVTIHKSQGSEYKTLIMPMVNQHFIMLDRTLFYTGVTRAKDVCVVVGSKEAARTAVHTNKIKARYSGLVDFFYK